VTTIPLCQRRSIALAIAPTVTHGPTTVETFGINYPIESEEVNCSSIRGYSLEVTYGLITAETFGNNYPLCPQRSIA